MPEKLGLLRPKAYAKAMEQQTTQQAPESAPHTPGRPGGKFAAVFAKYSKHKVPIIIAGAVVVVAVAGLVMGLGMGGKDGAQNTATNQQTNQANQTNTGNAEAGTSEFARQYLQGCKDRSVSFTHSPLPISQMAYMIPMGQMSDGHVTPTDHVYLAPLNQNAPDNTYDVVMPADGTVSVVAAMPAQYIGDKNQQVAPEDHRIAVMHNCQYVSIFIHVHQLSEKLQAALGGKLEPNTSKQVSVELKAGEKVGKIGGNPVDWTLTDTKQTLGGFITPDLYKTESWKIHTIDPVSVYTGSAKADLIAKSLRTVEPYGGKIDYDKKGALIGNWFREGTNGYAGASQERYWDGHLSVVPDHIDPSGKVVSVGNWNGKAAQMMVKGSVDPATVTEATGIVKYELIRMSYSTASGQQWTGGMMQRGMKASQGGPMQGTAVFQVQAGEKLKAEFFPGKSAAQVSGFTAAAQTYVR